MPHSSENIGSGILAGALTGVFWGLPFLAPQVLKGFSAVEIAFGRFFFFGLISLFFLGPVVEILRKLGPKERFRLVLLSASGFWLYSALLFWGIQRTDGILSSLILGMLPVTIPLFSDASRSDKQRATPGILLILTGLSLLFVIPGIQGRVRWSGKDWSGALVLLGCLALWTWYAVANGVFLRQNPWVSRRHLSSVMGVLSLAFMVPWMLVGSAPLQWPDRPGFAGYLMVSFGLGAGSSWFANWLWNYCSYHVPPAISGTLLVFETLFGLLYSFAFEQRLPRMEETAAILLCLGGVLWSVLGRQRDRSAGS